MIDKREIHEQVYDLVRQIPRGRVSTYGKIANVLGISPRYVGFVLHQNPYAGEVPCHRVVAANGRVAANFAFGGGDAQRELLEREGVTFVRDRVDKRCIIDL